MGFYIRGLFLGVDSTQRVEDDKIVTTWFVGVAVGTDAYRVYLKEGQEEEAKTYTLGDEVMVKVRPYSGKRGVGFSDGVFGK